MEQGKDDDDDMRDHYDFSGGRKNPYISMLKKQITIRIDDLTIAYFKDLSVETGIKYQQLINLYLSDCARKKLKPNISWEE
jgi:predicted DNA binding CopG/RHH family protein